MQTLIPCFFYDKKYIKAKVRQYQALIKTNFWGDEIPKEDVHHAL